LEDGTVEKRVLLTVGVEDYYQVGSFEGLIARENWYRFETRIARNTEKALELFDDFGIRATFFVLGCVAEAMPEIVREIARRGHEVASGGYWHRTIRQMTPEEFRDDLKRSREALERATGTRILGHRVPHFLGPQDLWALDIVAEEGYAYDSSVRPLFRRFAKEPGSPPAAGTSGRSPPRRCSSAASPSRSPGATATGNSRTLSSSRWSSAGRTGTAPPSSCTATSGSSTPSSRGSIPARS